MVKNLKNAYRNTIFRIFSNTPFDLKIDVYSKALNQCFKYHNAKTCTIITAYNPYSKRITDAENIKKNIALLSEINKSGFNYLDAIGLDPQNEWEGEASFFIFNISQLEAQRMGNKYQQNAIVWAETDCIPRLIFLCDLAR